MGQLPDLQEARRRLELALEPIHHDRWILGFLRGGCVQPIVSSEISRRFMHRHPLMPLSRKALYERMPTVVNAVIEAYESTNDYDWELDWPALLYTPVARIGHRPVGLLIIGSRTDHWYSDQEIAYARTLGMSLTPMVSALRGPLGRLTETEALVAQLLSHGLSHVEIARALDADEYRARSLAEKVARRLESVPADQLALLPIKVRPMTW
jgi:DNA-binding CsgD family transcriptional regulator